MSHILFLLLCGHALCDYPLQGDTMAKLKNRNTPIDPARVPPGQKPAVTWQYWLTAHALIHGGMVALVTGVWWLGLAETVVHWVIDFAKCENVTNIHGDQALHVLCKIAWAGLC